MTDIFKKKFQKLKKTFLKELILYGERESDGFYLILNLGLMMFGMNEDNWNW